MIIPVDETNIAQAAAVYSVSWKESHRAFCTPEFIERHTTDRQREYLQNKMSTGTKVYILVDERPVGIVSVTDRLIEDLYVLPDMQNRGYGTELLKFAIDLCADTPRLWILENNLDAERLYRRMGFMETGRRKSIANGLDELELALTFISDFQRIVILGCPGSGKSTFARKLHERTGLPLIHLDNLWWKPDRTHVTREAFDRALKAVMSAERWIIDGDYSRTYEVRIQACDTVIFLDYDAKTCMNGIVERVGRSRPDIPWVERQLDPELVNQVKSYGSDNRPVIYALLDKYPDKRALVFSSRLEAERWFSECL